MEKMDWSDENNHTKNMKIIVNKFRKRLLADSNISIVGFLKEFEEIPLHRYHTLEKILIGCQNMFSFGIPFGNP
jgi:hypothetical protein